MPRWVTVAAVQPVVGDNDLRADFPHPGGQLVDNLLGALQHAVIIVPHLDAVAAQGGSSVNGLLYPQCFDGFGSEGGILFQQLVALTADPSGPLEYSLPLEL